MNKTELVTIRPYHPEDKNFIYASWLRGLYYGESVFSLMQKADFMHGYHKFIDFLLSKPDVEIKIACLIDKPDTILGYSVLTGNNLHYVFVKKSWRGIGIAADLVPSDISAVTHLTKVGLAIVKKKDLVFNPFAL